MDPEPVPRALGEFEIVAVLGRGGSSTVYDAIWGPRRVALKVLHAELVGRAQFLAEARRLQAIVHPSVVKVLAVGELPDGRPYLAMERLEGETLASTLSRGAVPLPRALEIFAQLCEAVAILHSQELIHRDLKPENVFIVADRHAVLLDFGIAKELGAPASTTTQDGAVRGTPAYMAPERFFGQPAGVATDVYELAVILYAMVAGRLPWDNLVDPEARLQPRPLDGVPPELDVEIRRAMSTRAQNRPLTATAFRDSIRAAAAAAPGVGPPGPPPVPSETAPLPQAPTAPSTKPWFADREHETERGKTPLAWAPTAAATLKRSRRRWWIAGAGAIVTAAIVITVAATRRGEREPEPVVTHRDITQPIPKQNDPWGPDFVADAPPEPPKKPSTPIEADGDARHEAAAALAHLPADSRMVFQMIVSELERDRYIKAMIDKLVHSDRIELIAAFTPPCVKKLLGKASWLVYGMVTLEQFNGVLVAGTSMRRSELEACFAADATQVAMPDGAKLFRLHDDGFVDFLDDHTVVVAMRKDLTAAKVHDLVKKGGVGASRRATEMLAELPVNRSLSIVVDGHGSRWPADVLPKESDMSTWIRVLDDGVYLDFELDAHADAAAKSFEGQIRPQIDDLFANTDADAIGKLEVVRDHTVVRVRGKLTALILSLAVTQL